MSPDYDPQRQFRIPDSEWEPFEQAAKAVPQANARSPRGAVLREFIRWYMRRPGAKLPTRPDVGPWSAVAEAPSEQISAEQTASKTRTQVE